MDRQLTWQGLSPPPGTPFQHCALQGASHLPSSPLFLDLNCFEPRASELSGVWKQAGSKVRPSSPLVELSLWPASNACEEHFEEQEEQVLLLLAKASRHFLVTEVGLGSLGQDRKGGGKERKFRIIMI